jgi:hypothetical protein
MLTFKSHVAAVDAGAFVQPSESDRTFWQPAGASDYSKKTYL